MKPKHLLPTLLLLALPSALLADPPKTGSFALTFTQRSPLSEIKALTRRLKVPFKPPEKPVDYDLSTETCQGYIPEKYDPQKPLTLIVLALYKESTNLPPAVLPELADNNAALIVPKEYLTTWYQRAGLALDAAFNLQQRYNIDPHHIYLFGGGDWPDKDGTETMVAPRAGIFFPDVFTGTLATAVWAYRKVPAGANRFYDPQMPRPDPAQFTLDRARPFVYAMQQEAEDSKLFLASYKTDGFKFTTTLPITADQFHYPNFQPGWIPQALKFMNTSTATLKLPSPTTQPTTRP